MSGAAASHRAAAIPDRPAKLSEPRVGFNPRENPCVVFGLGRVVSLRTIIPATNTIASKEITASGSMRELSRTSP